MSGGTEAAGDIVTGTAWARTVEPAAGSDGAPKDTHATCLNCGTGLVGRYCHACGQSSHVHRTLMSIVHDLAHGVFHFEGKIWRTIPMLALRPGQLTRRYIDGERARFVSPLALFLFTVFLMFAIYSAFAAENVMSSVTQGWNTVQEAPLGEARARTQQKLSRAIADRARLAAAAAPTAEADRRIADAQRQLAEIADADRQIPRGADGKLSIHSRWQWLNEGIEHASENPSLSIYKVQSAAYKYSWVLILLSTPLVWLTMFWRRRYTMYDHATFVTYSITFMSILTIVLTLLGVIGVPGVLLKSVAALVPPAHLFVQLRGTYSLGIFGALWRTAFLIFFATNALALFFLGVIALEVAA